MSALSSISKVIEPMLRDLIPGLNFKSFSRQGVQKRNKVSTEEGKSTQELRRLAFDFPRDLPTRPVKPEKPKHEKSEEAVRKTRDPHDNWGKENVDFRVRRVLMKRRVVKQEKNKEKVTINSEGQVKAGKSLGKFGRGDLPHEFWEEERRLREKKRKERLAKEKNSSTICLKEEEGLPSSDSPGAGPDLKDLSSNEVTNLSSVNPVIETIIDNILGDVISKKAEGSPLMTDGSSSEVEEEENVGASEDDPILSFSGSQVAGAYFQDLGANKVTHVFNEARKEIPCLTSDSESDVEEEERMPAGPSSDGGSDKDEAGKRVLEDGQDQESDYFKDWESNTVFTYNKDQLMSDLKSAIKRDLKLVAEDTDSQYGDDESEKEEEEGKKKQRRKSLPRGRGGASQWEALAEEERLRMVATMRKKMVAIAVKAQSHGIYISFDQYFYRLLITRTLK